MKVVARTFCMTDEPLTSYVVVSIDNAMLERIRTHALYVQTHNAYFVEFGYAGIKALTGERQVGTETERITDDTILCMADEDIVFLHDAIPPDWVYADIEYSSIRVYSRSFCAVIQEMNEQHVVESDTISINRLEREK